MENVTGFLLNKYAPLALPQVLNDMPQDYLKILPRFNWENESDAQKHLETFFSFAENFNVEHLDVVLRLFVQSLDGEAQKWFKTLASCSITTWDNMEDTFLRKWGRIKIMDNVLLSLIHSRKDIMKGCQNSSRDLTNRI